MPKVVIAVDFLETYSGAERITAEMARAFPEAPIYGLLGRRSVAERMGVADRFVSVLPSRRRLLKHFRLLAPVYPLVADAARLEQADVVLSGSYGFAHRLRSENDAPRVVYSYSPLRFAWSMTDQYRERWAGSGLAAEAFKVFADAMRESDFQSSQSVDRYLAPAGYVAQQIRLYYGRDAEIVGTPVDTELFSPTGDPPGDYYLYCGRLIEPYKKVTPLVEAFNRLGERLVVAGDGPERARLEAIAGPNIDFAGKLDDRALVEAMRKCRAVVFPSQDDFGLVPLETMACGRPVLAFAGGGALDQILPGVTGEFFESQTPEAIADAVSGFQPGDYEPERIREHATQWDSARFRERLQQVVAEVAG